MNWSRRKVFPPRPSQAGTLAVRGQSVLFASRRSRRSIYSSSPPAGASVSANAPNNPYGVLSRLNAPSSTLTRGWFEYDLQGRRSTAQCADGAYDYCTPGPGDTGVEMTGKERRPAGGGACGRQPGRSPGNTYCMYVCGVDSRRFASAHSPIRSGLRYDSIQRLEWQVTGEREERVGEEQ
ncbi:hypothetical protein BD414DRAFT_144149 [Trametes punicea]|nr:hypothetical protein BD414DRAFT_144149 [Trametes punicea]